MFNCLPDSAWDNGNLAEAARQLGKMVEHLIQSQLNPGLRADGTPCTFLQVGHVAQDGEDEHAGDQGGPGVDGARD